MITVPDVTNTDAAFGSIKHMPKYEDVPEEFKNFSNSNKYCRFISIWFFKGVSKEKIETLIPKEGVDKWKALAVIKCIIGSFEPKHEHKEAGCAYLLSQWFDINERIIECPKCKTSINRERSREYEIKGDITVYICIKCPTCEFDIIVGQNNGDKRVDFGITPQGTLKEGVGKMEKLNETTSRVY